MNENRPTPHPEGPGHERLTEHAGTLRVGVPEHGIRVVPGSGTGELAGPEDRFHLGVAEGAHRHLFEYAAPERPMAAGVTSLRVQR